MERGDTEPGELVEAPESDSQSLFPVVGTDRTPTPEMIAQGLVGNGSMNILDHQVQVRYEEHRQKVAQEKDERRKFFHEEAKDGLKDAIAFHRRIIEYGNKVMERIEKPVEDNPVTAKDMQVLSMAQKSAKELVDRGVGRAKAQETEHETKSSVLQMIARK